MKSVYVTPLLMISILFSTHAYSQPKKAQTSPKCLDFDCTIRGVIELSVETGSYREPLQIRLAPHPSIRTVPANIKILTINPIKVTSNARIEKLVNGKRTAATLDDLRTGFEVEVQELGRRYAPYYEDCGMVLDSILILGKNQRKKAVLLNDPCER
jgi:hypothetical protein